MAEITTDSIKERLANISDGITNSMYESFALVEWWPLLAKECQVYVYNESYIAKRFDQINFKFCTKDIAKEILIDNLYAILRNKYFPKATDESQEKIDKIVKSFTTNLKTVLLKVSFDEDSECKKVSLIPDGCVAFRNGVFDFRHNDWLFKYERVDMPKNSNCIYIYDSKWIITWYVNINFEPLDVIDLSTISFEEFFELAKALDQESKNYCFELMYNMAHDYENKFSEDKFKHLCEILGYLCLQSFSQNFVIMVGSGQNGKNSLIDGCFTPRVIPAPANVDMKSLELDKFVTGALENKAQCIFLETEAETMVQSKMIKALTGSMHQTIEHKGEDRYSGEINCKFLWAANDQDKLKFSDVTVGFKRRINIYELTYRWDSSKKFLTRGDYYDTTFSESLVEIKGDLSNTIMFIYMAMMGIRIATADYTKQFRFSSNDYRLQYTDIDFELRERVEAISQEKLAAWFSKPANREAGKSMFFDFDRKALYLSPTMREYGVNNYEDFIDKFLRDEEGSDIFLQYFVEHDVYMSLRHMQDLVGDLTNSRAFTQAFKKTFNIPQLAMLSANKPYAKVTFVNNKLKVVQ